MNTTKYQPHFDRRNRTHKEIKQLIAERNSLLTQYYTLAHLVADQSATGIESLKELLQEFCQNLIDYIATGHFEIYRRIEDGIERREDIMTLANEIFHKIINTTNAAVDFNDQYDLNDNLNTDSLKNFPKQLTELGLNLATRIELEDKFINTLLSSNPAPVYSPH
jgi:regulator of sigma D